MAMSPSIYAQAGQALFNKDWVSYMWPLLDIRRTVGYDIAYANAHEKPYDMPPGLEEPLRQALAAKMAACAEALLALDEGA